MSDEIRRYMEHRVRAQLDHARSLLATGRGEEALRLVNRIDSEYPNRKDVLELRVRCMQASNRRQFQEWSEDDDKLSTDFEPSRIEWLDVRVDKDEPKPNRLVYTPALTAFDPNEYRDPEPKVVIPEPTRGLFSFAIWAVVIAVYGLLLVQQLIPRLRGGEVREFGDMQFVWIPPGRNLSPVDTKERSAPVAPGFWIGRYEVTQSQWYALMESNPSAHNGNRLPVETVTPDEVLEFLDRLNRIGAGRFRLPTDAEWKRASLGDPRTAKEYESYADKLEQIAWYSANSEDITHEVGGKKPSGWGLYDQHGNVAEWCVNHKQVATLTVPGATIEDSGQFWVAKGGSAIDDIDSLSPLAAYAPGNYDRTFVGLRLVREAGKDPSGAVRTVHFPKRYSLGTLRTARRPIGEATGNVTVRRDEELILEFSKDAKEHWNDLAKLRPNDLTELVAANLELTDAEVAVLGKLEGLERLNLSTNSITDSAIRNIATLSSLKQLRLGNTQITGGTLHRLAEIKDLEYLSLSRCQKLTGSVVSEILALENLKMLDVYGCGFSNDQILQLQVGLPECIVAPAPAPPTPEMSLTIASVGHKYAMLIDQFADPDAAEDYGFFMDAGYIDSINYRELDRPAGYWVYVKPYWYIWNGLTREYSPRRLGLERQTAPWSAKNAIGAPDYDDYPGAQSAWSPGRLREESSWLTLEFERPLTPVLLRLYLSNSVVNLSKVSAFSLTGEEIVLWRFIPVVTQEAGAWIAELALLPGLDNKYLTTKVTRVRLYIDSETEWAFGGETADSLGTRIDAVQLIDGSGDAVWARAAIANSSFGEYAESDGGTKTPSGKPRFIDPATIEYRGVYGLLLDLSGGGSAAAGEGR